MTHVKERGQPLVSVILPIRDRADFLRRSAGSVLAQTFRDLELIIVDDGSTEDVQAAAHALNDPRVVFVRRNVNGGVAAARNTGIGAARGEYLAFQDSDDEWLLDKLQRQVDAIRTHGMTICGLLRLTGGRTRAYLPPAAKHERVITHQSVIAHPITYTQTWLVRTELVRNLGGFDERLRVWEDWELLLRLTGQTEAVIDPEPLAISEQLAGGLTTHRAPFINSMTLILAKHERSLAAYPAAHAALHYLHGRLLALEGRSPEARTALKASIRMNPRALRPWALAAASLLGPGFVRWAWRAGKSSGSV